MTEWNIDELNVWGHRMSWTNYKTRNINGHLSMPRVQVGDTVVCQMKTNYANATQQFRRYVVTEVEYMVDPNDQFFGKVRDIGITTLCQNGKIIVLEEGKRCPYCNKKIKSFVKGSKHLEKKHEAEFMKDAEWS